MVTDMRLEGWRGRARLSGFKIRGRDLGNKTIGKLSEKVQNRKAGWFIWHQEKYKVESSQA